MSTCQLSAILSQLAGTNCEPRNTGNTSFENYEQSYSSSVDIEFDKEHFLVELRKYASIWNKQHPGYKQTNIKVKAWKSLATTSFG